MRVVRSDSSTSFVARVFFITRRVVYLRDSRGASGIVETRSPTWYFSGVHVCRYVTIIPKLYESFANTVNA